MLKKRSGFYFMLEHLDAELSSNNIPKDRRENLNILRQFFLKKTLSSSHYLVLLLKL